MLLRFSIISSIYPLRYDPSKTFARQSIAHVRLRTLCPGRRIRQPRHQPDGAVSQPGDARPGIVFAAAVPPLVGHPDDSGEHLGAVRGAGFPHTRDFRARADHAPVRHRRHLVDHRQHRQGAGDVPDGARAFAGQHDRGGRARGGDSRRGGDAGCRPHREGRRHRVDARTSWARMRRRRSSIPSFGRASTCA